MEEALRKHITEGDGYVDVTLYVKPEASFTGLRMELGELVFYTEELDVEGRVNASIVMFFSRLLGVSPSMIDIVYGTREKTKRVRIKNVTWNQVFEKIVEALRESEARS
ncbi:DUF167 domain-containing protein [Hyperthermus butylicus]|uniref:Uncharacterized protein n=1 Tax=Hyperthermus butylicus (strain DSM 5456 / JCM 9403 / PLM1-5) TaxID=415426 RepID=A2BM02_HYPBU|nr:DUF167 domain-containing protein [Hyperthermus butylicus]ABM81013.1 hypothetical protein Hbut_1179 [Hyperthermus butylicus DSM 5456]